MYFQSCVIVFTKNMSFVILSGNQIKIPKEGLQFFVNILRNNMTIEQLDDPVGLLSVAG